MAFPDAANEIWRPKKVYIGRVVRFKKRMGRAEQSAASLAPRENHSSVAIRVDQPLHGFPVALSARLHGQWEFSFPHSVIYPPHRHRKAD